MKNKFRINKDVVIIELQKGHEAKISPQDLFAVSLFQGRWYAKKDKQYDLIYAVGNITVNGQRTQVKMHRYILNCPDGYEVDHINHDGLDNQRNNIETVLGTENMQNKRPYINNKSGVKGVSWSKNDKKWYARLKVNGVYVFSKRFNDLKEAEVAITEARRKYHKYAAKIGII